MPAPQVDLFILNYNNGRFLPRTVESVLNQTYAAKRVIISDNGSTDGSDEAALRDYNARGLELVHRRPGTGDCYRHANLCVGDSRAPYVAIFHGDDVYTPEMVARQIDCLEKNPDLDAVLTGAMTIGSGDEPLWPIRLPVGFDQPRLNPMQVLEWVATRGNSFFICPSALFRREAFERVGLFRPDLPYCGDLEMWLRILFRGRGLGYLDEPLIRYRMTTAQGSGVYERTRTDASEYFTMLSEVLDWPEVAPHLKPQVRQEFEALRRLDLYQAGLNRVARGDSMELMQENLRWLLSRENRACLSNFGALDRLKIQGGRVAVTPALARALLRVTDARSNRLLRLALRLKRKGHK